MSLLISLQAVKLVTLHHFTLGVYFCPAAANLFIKKKKRENKKKLFTYHACLPPYSSSWRRTTGQWFTEGQARPYDSFLVAAAQAGLKQTVDHCSVSVSPSVALQPAFHNGGLLLHHNMKYP